MLERVEGGRFKMATAGKGDPEYLLVEIGGVCGEIDDAVVIKDPIRAGVFVVSQRDVLELAVLIISSQLTIDTEVVGFYGEEFVNEIPQR